MNTKNDDLTFLCRSNQHSRDWKNHRVAFLLLLKVPELLVLPITNKDDNIKYNRGRYRNKEFEENVSLIYEQGKETYFNFHQAQSVNYT